MGEITDITIKDGWKITTDITPSIDFRTGSLFHPKKYECIACGYKTGLQAKQFKYCPICGDKK